MLFLSNQGETEALTGDQIADEVATLAASDPTLALCNSEGWQGAVLPLLWSDSYHDTSVSDRVCFYLGVTMQTDLWNECVRCVERVPRLSNYRNYHDSRS